MSANAVTSPASCCGGGEDRQSPSANADSSDGRTPDVASGDGVQGCAWHGADDQEWEDDECGEQHADGDRCGGDRWPSLAGRALDCQRRRSFGLDKYSVRAISEGY